MSENLSRCIISNVFEGGQEASVILDPGGDKVVPMKVSSTQGKSIELGRIGRDFRRPLTHTLMLKILDDQGIKIDEVILIGLSGSAILGELRMKKEKEDDERYHYDVRPSDGIALAVRTDAEILISNELVEKIGVSKEKLENKIRKNNTKTSKTL